LAAELPVALEAGEVQHVPRAALRFCTFVRKNYLEMKYDSNCSLVLVGKLKIHFDNFVFVLKRQILSIGSQLMTKSNLVFTSSQAEHRGFIVSAWCLPQKSFASL